jgi:hypothetical protein
LHLTIRGTPVDRRRTLLPDHADKRKLLDAWLALTDPAVPFIAPVRLPMLSGSMAPRIPIDSELVIAPVGERICASGDVVVFLRDGRLVAHRVLLVVGWGPGALLLEKGDSNLGVGWIRRRDVRGVVVDRIPTDPRRRTLPLTEHGAVRQSVNYSLRTLLRRLLRRGS